MKLQVTVRIGQWLLVAIAALLLTGGLLAIFVLDASTSRSVVAAEKAATSDQAQTEGEK